jgi:lipoate-protein ligase A
VLASGSGNMALDEAIIEAVAAGQAPPTLRFYGWRGRWLSIGMAESIADVDVAACRATATGVVRRPSGGTAVLHVDHLAWSLTLPDGHALAPGDIVRSYAQQADVTLAALRALGVAARGATPPEAKAPLPDPVLEVACFGGLAPHEIVAGAPPRKLVGWGQVRRRGVVMHHATVPRRFDPAALPALLAADRSALTEALARRVVGLDELAGRRVSSRSLVSAIVESFAAHGYAWERGCPSAAELRRARVLLDEKYGAESWTARR